MPDDSTAAPPPAPHQPSGGDAASLNKKRIFLIAYPKIVFMYPTFFTALLCGLVMLFSSDHAGRTGEILTLGFLGVLTLNFVVLTFDFPRTTSLTLFFFIAMVGMGLFLLFYVKPDLMPVVGQVFGALKPTANAHFFLLLSAMMFVFYLAVLVAVRFDYWEVRPNELLHHHGFLSDLKRYPAPNLRIDKEINDVFEYALLRSGRLILHARTESRAIVLDNVLFINRKEQMLTNMLGSLQVSLRADDEE